MSLPVERYARIPRYALVCIFHVMCSCFNTQNPNVDSDISTLVGIGKVSHELGTLPVLRKETIVKEGISFFTCKSESIALPLFMIANHSHPHPGLPRPEKLDVFSHRPFAIIGEA